VLLVHVSDKVVASLRVVDKLVRLFARGTGAESASQGVGGAAG
jgi:hypothetical protein